MRGWARWLAVGSLWAVACGADPAGSTALSAADAAVDAAGSETSGQDAVAPDSADAATSADAQPDIALGPGPGNLQVHHWATFTVFHAAAAQAYVPGVGRAEEELPAFAHSRPLAALGPPLAKLQTAGAFFHADSAGDVQVELALPQGQVEAEWPPAVTGTTGAAAALTGGHATWKLRIDPKAQALPALAAVEPTSLWHKLRGGGGARVSNLGAAAGSDDLLFYRALGNFAPPVRVTAKKYAAFPGYSGTVANDGAAPIPRAWLLYLHAGGGLMQPLGPVPGQGASPFSPTPKELPTEYFAKVQATLTQELQQAGLTAAEAQALVGSFTHNWLKTHGLRVIVLAPQAWAETAFLAKVTPQPVAEVRVALGRIELLTEEDEGALLAQLAAAVQAGDSGLLQSLGFFAEPKARRAQAASADPAVKALAGELAKQAAGVK